ncbi:his Kinase A domain protein [Clostridium sporogenes]|uniref:histidine kinase n=1 Tax=Clostridium sporogenes TaxID=1509 RepID=A0A1L3NI54_CLOSG|nr:HAMP domain-containing sensor histidine kinase [Clostridium sporogenes]APH15751.1 his Kinase A domain protein [Clostridium sporogenes]
MNENIFKEPITRKTIFLFLGLMTVMLCFQSFYFYNMINKIQNQEIKNYESIIGTLVKIAPEKQYEIGQSLFENKQKDTLNLGKSLLEQYGYKENMYLLNNKISGNIYINFLHKIIIVSIVTMILFVALAIFSYKSIFKKLEEISYSLKRVVEGDCSISLKDNKEGIICKIAHEFNIMVTRTKSTLENLDKEKEKTKALVNDISHQLKTPLSSLELFNTLLMEENLEGNERIEFLEKSKYEINNLQWLVKALIKVSRLETGMIDIKPDYNDIKNTLLEAINSIYGKALEKNLNIKADNLFSYKINHDKRWTKEALVNILENALKYTKETGYINISMEKSEMYIKINIKDSGIGIDKQELNKIFNRFYRGKNEIVQSTEGSGIGLYLAKWIIEQEGGTIRAKSTLGIGTTFSIIIFT